jgi:hypothetical protein
MTLYLALATGNDFLTTLMNSQYGLIMDIGLVVLPSWLLLWASPSFRRQLLATFLPNLLYEKIFGAPHTVTAIKAQHTIVPVKTVVAVRPMPIS